VTFPFNVYLAALAGAFVTALVALPLWRKGCSRVGLVDDPGERKLHDHPIPLAGGLAVATGLVVPAVIGILVFGLPYSAAPGHGAGPPIVPLPQSPPGSLFDSTTRLLLGYGVNRRTLELGGILFGALGMLMVGLLDDRYELKPAPKFGCQLAVAAIVAAAGARITLFVPSIVFSYAITILWILTVVNAFNFMDNMNGLCAGVGGISAVCFAAIAGVDGQYLVALLALLTCGALLGFLPYNFPRARVFLGDSGSHLVGYLLAVLAILPHFYTSKHPHVSAVFLPLLILAVPLADLTQVVILRWRSGKPFYVGDTNHLSHRLVRAGLSPKSAVLTLWLCSALLGALALLDWSVFVTRR
jgi:UDP-GlcNAc:undecaprenyl-phosphate GlcNAc-1-phosphate transferase